MGSSVGPGTHVLVCAVSGDGPKLLFDETGAFGAALDDLTFGRQNKRVVADADMSCDFGCSVKKYIAELVVSLLITSSL
jgi:hypothetical protein